MVDEDKHQTMDEEVLRGKSNRDKAFRAAWIYLRGGLVIVAFIILAKAAQEGYLRVEGWLEPFSEAFESKAPSVALTLSILIFGPWIVGKSLELLLAGKLFRRQRGFRAYRRMETKLATELRSDQRRGYRVALVNWPTAQTRSLGLIVADLNDPGTGQVLAAVYLPGTPDPTKGSIRILSSDDFQLTDWDLSDLTRFHITFGSAAPDLSDADSAS